MQALSEQMVPALREIAESLSTVQECLLENTKGWREALRPFPVASCWYAAFHGGECVYVGITKNLRSRLQSREFMNHPLIAIYFLPMPQGCSVELAKVLEGIFARALRPRIGFFLRAVQVSGDKDMCGEQRCLKCGHTWYPRMTGMPSRCPACYNRKWNMNATHQVIVVR